MEEKKEDPLMSTGKRLRKEVNYKELSDSQAFKMFEAGLDPNLESDVKRAKKQNVLGSASATSTQQDKAAATEVEQTPSQSVEKKDVEMKNNDDVIVSEGENEDEEEAAGESDGDDDYVVKSQRNRGKGNTASATKNIQGSADK